MLIKQLRQNHFLADRHQAVRRRHDWYPRACNNFRSSDRLEHPLGYCPSRHRSGPVSLAARFLAISGMPVMPSASAYLAISRSSL